jgi:hypothetical protein
MVIFYLPETLPADRRISGGLGKVIVAYGQILVSKNFIGYALCGGFIAGIMFAYISGSPFVFIELHGVAPHHYGWIFGINACGLICASQLNRLLLRRFNNITILNTMLWFIAASGLVLVLVALTKSADVMVVPSIYEPFGIVALEGMAAGVPVVASQIGGLTEFIEHDRTGIFVYPRNPESIAWGIDRVLSDYGHAEWLVKNAREVVHVDHQPHLAVHRLPFVEPQQDGVDIRLALGNAVLHQTESDLLGLPAVAFRQVGAERVKPFELAEIAVQVGRPIGDLHDVLPRFEDGRRGGPLPSVMCLLSVLNEIFLPHSHLIFFNIKSNPCSTIC